MSEVKTDFTVLFEDDTLLAVDKPVGIATVPGNDPVAVVSRLSEERREKLLVVHRLDKEASGVLVFARTPEMSKHLNGLFAAGTVRNRLTVFVHGKVRAEKGKINAPLRTFGSGRVGVDHKNGKPALSTWQVIERFSAGTLIDMTPRSSGRHQVRAHCYHIGHPIVGDPLYGEKARQQNFPRLMLHACTISFSLPNGESLTIESPLPQSFLAILEDFRRR